RSQAARTGRLYGQHAGNRTLPQIRLRGGGHPPRRRLPQRGIRRLIRDGAAAAGMENGAMMTPKITLTDAPTPEMRQAIADGLTAFNRSRANVNYDPRPLALLISDPRSGETVGGLHGATWISYLYISLLFVPEKMRGAGLGRTLMLEAEAEAI